MLQGYAYIAAAVPAWPTRQGFPDARVGVLVMTAPARPHDHLRGAIATCLAEAARTGTREPHPCWRVSLRADARHPPLGRIWYGGHEEEPALES